MNYHTLKEAIVLFFFPLPLSAELLTAGALLLLAKRRRAGKALVITGLLTLLLFTTYPLPQFMLTNLEGRYPMFDRNSLASNPAVRYVVVLSGGFCRADLPVTSILDPSSVARLDDGVSLFLRLKQFNPKTRLVVTGKEESHYLAGLSEDLGVKRDDIIIENGATNTHEQAQLVKKITGGERFFLVTSASHMPRAMALFKKAGTSPVPVPADYMAKVARGLYWYIPRADNVKKSETAFYEYLGLIKERLAGNI